jgi:hypothetical protein
MRLHAALCPAQAACWHAFPQYRTDLHAPHSFSLPSKSSADTPQRAHSRAPPRARRPGLAPTRDVPSPGGVVTGASEGCACLGLVCEVERPLWLLADLVGLEKCFLGALGFVRVRWPARHFTGGASLPRVKEGYVVDSSCRVGLTPGDAGVTCIAHHRLHAIVLGS